MKAMVHTKPYEFEMQEYDVPSISDSEVLLRVKAVGICGSDVHGMSGKTGRRQTPIVMGHEAAGIIVKKGRAVQGFDMDERVTFDSTVYCNNCTFCFTGRANLCDNRKVLGVSCDDRKLEMAKELGADFMINSGRQDPREVLLEETGRAEVDVSVEAVGLDASVNTALSVVRKGGTVVLIGNWTPGDNPPASGRCYERNRRVGLRGLQPGFRCLRGSHRFGQGKGRLTDQQDRSSGRGPEVVSNPA